MANELWDDPARLVIRRPYLVLRGKGFAAVAGAAYLLG